MNISDMTKNDQLRAIIRELEAENHQLRDALSLVVSASGNYGHEGFYRLDYGATIYDKFKALVGNEAVQE